MYDRSSNWQSGRILISNSDQRNAEKKASGAKGANVGKKVSAEKKASAARPASLEKIPVTAITLLSELKCLRMLFSSSVAQKFFLKLQVGCARSQKTFADRIPHRSESRL